MQHSIEGPELDAQKLNASGEWEEVPLGKGIKALVILNLQSYGGGRDLWGLQDMGRDKAKGWKPPIFNDGLIEVRPLGKLPGVKVLPEAVADWTAWSCPGLSTRLVPTEMAEVLVICLG